MKINILLLLSFFTLSAIGQINQTDNQGRKHGLWKKHHENGKLRFEGRFEHGVEKDTFKFYFDDGKLQAVNYFRKPGVVYSKQYGGNNVLAAEGLYKNKEKDSIWTYYNIEGKVISTEEFEKGKKNGASIVYYDNGKKAELITFKDDKRVGEWKQFYEDGKPKASGNYVNDALQGEVIYYHPNGKILAKGNFVKGKMHGTWYYFTEDFKFDRKEEWHYGRNLKREDKSEEYELKEKDTGTK